MGSYVEDEGCKTGLVLLTCYSHLQVINRRQISDGAVPPQPIFTPTALAKGDRQLLSGTDIIALFFLAPRIDHWQ